MKNKSTIILLLVALALWIAGASYCYVCKIRKDCGSCNKTQVDKKEDNLPETPVALPYDGLNLVDGDRFSYSDAENIYFNENSNQLNVNPSLNDGFGGLAKYINGNKDRTLVITGLYKSSEGGPELGLERADTIASYLNDTYNIPLDRIERSYKETNDLYINEGKTYGAAGFSFNLARDAEEDASEEELDKLKANLMATRNVYFATGSSIMNMTPELHQFMDDLKYYLAKRPTSKVSLTGYTDNTGNATANYSLSASRSKDVLAYITKERGMDPKHFNTSGLGPEDPLASNDTEEGRALNRRVEIKLN